MADAAGAADAKPPPARDEEWHDYSIIGSFEELTHSIESVLQSGISAPASHFIASGDSRTHRLLTCPAQPTSCALELSTAPRETLLTSLLGLTTPLALLLPVELSSDVWGSLSRTHAHTLLSAALCAREHVATRARSHGEAEPSMALLAALGAPSQGGYIGHAVGAAGLESYVYVRGSVDEHAGVAVGRYSAPGEAPHAQWPRFKLDPPPYAPVSAADQVVRSGRDVMRALGGAATGACATAQLYWHASVGRIPVRVHVRFKSCDASGGEGFFDRLSGPVHALSVWDVTRPRTHVCIATHAPSASCSRSGGGAESGGVAAGLEAKDEHGAHLGLWATGAAALALACEAVCDMDDANRDRCVMSARVTVAQIQALGDDVGLAARAWNALTQASAHDGDDAEANVFILTRGESALALGAQFAASLEPPREGDDTVRARVKRAIESVAPDTSASRFVKLTELERSLDDVSGDGSNVQAMMDDFVDACATMCSGVCSRALRLKDSRKLDAAAALLRCLDSATVDGATAAEARGIIVDSSLGRTLAGIVAFMYTRLIQRLRNQFESAVQSAAEDAINDDGRVSEVPTPRSPASISTDAPLLAQRLGLLAHALFTIKHARAQARARASARAAWRSRSAAVASPLASAASDDATAPVLDGDGDDDEFQDMPSVGIESVIVSVPSPAANAGAPHSCAFCGVRVLSATAHALPHDGAATSATARVLIGPLMSRDSDSSAEAEAATVDVHMMSEPDLCDAPPTSVETLTADVCVMNQLSLNELRSHVRSHVSVELLRADMCVFKAANAGAHVIDFIRWYFPQAWSPTAHASACVLLLREGHVELETLMAACGHVAVCTDTGDRCETFSPVVQADHAVRWVHMTLAASASPSASVPMSAKAWQSLGALWDTAHPLPRACAPPLWNPQAVGETVLTALEAETAEEVVSHICAAVFVAASEEISVDITDTALTGTHAAAAAVSRAAALRAAVASDIGTVNANMALDESDATGTGVALRRGRTSLARILHVLNRTRDVKLAQATAASGSTEATADVLDDTTLSACIVDMTRALDVAVHTSSMRATRRAHARSSAAVAVRLAFLAARACDASILAGKAAATYKKMQQQLNGDALIVVNADAKQRALVNALVSLDSAQGAASVAAHSFGFRSPSYAALGGRAHEAVGVFTLADADTDEPGHLWAAAVLMHVLDVDGRTHDVSSSISLTNKSDRGRAPPQVWETLPLPAPTYTSWVAHTRVTEEAPTPQYATLWDEVDTLLRPSASVPESSAVCACEGGHTRPGRSMTALIPGPALQADGALTTVASVHTQRIGAA